MNPNTQNPNWRAEFRLHALDLNTIEPAVQAPDHWVLQDSDFAAMANTVIADCDEARRCGSHVDLPRSAHEFVSGLPIAADGPPQTILRHALFSFRFSSACGRQSVAAMAARRKALAAARPRA